MDNNVVASSVPSPNKNIPSPKRPIADFHPSVWGNYFLKYTSDLTQIDDNTKEQHKQLMEEVRKKLLVSGSDEPSEQQLKLIDATQRLGVAYHFEGEIDTALNNQFVTFNGSSGDQFNPKFSNIGDDLNMVSLCFRLLRQHGHRVSCDIFNKFKDSEGRFKESLTNDVRGILSLYESAHMRVRDEDTLHEALEFTTTHLNKVVNSLCDPVLESEVVHALKWPIRKCLTRVEARMHHIPTYEKEEYHDETLLKFAKLDFNVLQKVHQRELSYITSWWKELNVAEELPYARDRVVEIYFWIYSVYFEPKYVFGRIFLTKVLAVTSLIDDTYDAYGTIDELSLFTDAIQRWDADATDQLPKYMQHIYRALLDAYTGIEEELSKEGTIFRLDFAKQSMKQLVRAYFHEAIWSNEGYVPTVEDHAKVTLVSCAYIMTSTNSFVGMGTEQVTKHDFEWVSNNPLMVRASSVVTRLTDDIVGHEFEQKREHVASGIECYMKQYGATKEDSISEFNKRITDAWMDINEECLNPTAVPMVLLERILNLTRFINLVYKGEDGYTHSSTQTKGIVTSLFVEDISLNLRDSSSNLSV